MVFNCNFPIKLNIINLPFKSGSKISKPEINKAGNTFVTNPIYDNLSTKEQIEFQVISNPNIQRILKEKGIPLAVNLKELENLKQNHLKNTRIVTMKIYSALPDETKKNINITDLQNAALLHDFGKVLIPEKVLNKTKKLNEDERDIMQIHSEFSYELLKNKGLSENCLNLIRNHHQNCLKTGYPKVEKDYSHSIEAQILNIADKYTALIEKRCYKNPLSKYEALEILAKEVNNGLISQEVYTALLKNI